jgi:predicted enzyme related to lactoylglutathione lyase
MGAHFGFTKLVVMDLDAAAVFYTEVFGVEEQYRVHAEIAGRVIDEILFKATAPGAATFALLRFADQRSASHDEVILGFITTDIDTLFAKAVNAGGAVAQAAESQPEHGVRVGFLRDPEGHLIEVVELITAG